MGPALILLAFGLSVLPVLLAGGEGRFAGCAAALSSLELLPLALLPWVALAGLPAAEEPAPRPRDLGRLGGLALALPALALAARLDRAEGVGGGELIVTAGVGLLLALLLALAVPHGPSPGPGGDRALRARFGLYGLLWAALVALPPLLELVLVEVARGRGPAPLWPSELSAASPVGWLARRALGPAGSGSPWAPVALCLLLLWLPRLARPGPAEVDRAGGRPS